MPVRCDEFGPGCQDFIRRSDCFGTGTALESGTSALQLGCLSARLAGAAATGSAGATAESSPSATAMGSSALLSATERAVSSGLECSTWRGVGCTIPTAATVRTDREVSSGEATLAVPSIGASARQARYSYRGVGITGTT